MPFYEYECTQCGKHFEEKQTFEEHDRHPNLKCPKCGSKKVQQVMASVNVITSKKS